MVSFPEATGISDVVKGRSGIDRAGSQEIAVRRRQRHERFWTSCRYRNEHGPIIGCAFPDPTGADRFRASLFQQDVGVGASEAEGIHCGKGWLFAIWQELKPLGNA